MRFADVDDDCRLDLDQLRSLLSDRTRVVAFPWASNAVGTVTPVAEIAALAHEAGALAWVDAVHYAPHGPIDVAAVGADVLLCSPYKFYGPHLGLAVRPPRAARDAGGRTRCGPPTELPSAIASRRARSRTSCSPASSPRSSTCDESAGSSSPSTSGRSGSASSTACPTAGRCTGRRRWTAASRRSRSRSPSEPPEAAAERLGEAGFAVWHGDYYALEIMKRLGLEDGAVRVGIVHYNTLDEVDRLLAELAELAAG